MYNKSIIHYYTLHTFLIKGRILLAPFFDVTFADFWIADQLNSLASILLDMEFFICYLVYGMYTSESSGLSIIVELFSIVVFNRFPV